MITAPETQHALAEYVRRETTAITNEAQRVAATVTPRQLDWSPGKKEWSVGQVFEHLCISHDSYLDAIEGAMSSTKVARLADMKVEEGATSPPADARWSPRFAGGVLVRSLRSARKLAAPRAFRIGKVRANVIGEFVARQARLLTLLDLAAPLHWVDVRFGSPVSAVIRLNLGDCFLVLAEHARRHMQQVARVMATPGFAAV